MDVAEDEVALGVAPLRPLGELEAALDELDGAGTRERVAEVGDVDDRVAAAGRIGSGRGAAAAEDERGEGGGDGGGERGGARRHAPRVARARAGRRRTAAYLMAI